MKPCIDCQLRSESLARPDVSASLRRHYERLNALCLCLVPLPPMPRFVSHKQYMKLASEPVPASLLTLEPNLRPFVVH
jgi:hypothetical protein